MERTQLLPLSAAIALLLATIAPPGCSKTKSDDKAAEHELKYPPVSHWEEEVVDITPADLGVTESALAHSGGSLLAADSTEGRFPTGLAVVRVQAVSTDEAARRALRVMPVADYRGAYWNDEMSHLPQLREVTLPRKFGLDPRGADWRSVLRMAAAQNCDLCLIYSQVHNTNADTELVGVLWDALTEQALAAFRVPVQLPPEVRQKYEKKKQLFTLRSDAEFRAETELRRLVRDALWDLIVKDVQPSTTQPNPWDTDLPLFPRDYRRHMRIYIDERQPR